MTSQGELLREALASMTDQEQRELAAILAEFGLPSPFDRGGVKHLVNYNAILADRITTPPRALATGKTRKEPRR